VAFAADRNVRDSVCGGASIGTDNHASPVRIAGFRWVLAGAKPGFD